MVKRNPFAAYTKEEDPHVKTEEDELQEDLVEAKPDGLEPEETESLQEYEKSELEQVMEGETEPVIEPAPDVKELAKEIIQKDFKERFEHIDVNRIFFIGIKNCSKRQLLHYNDRNPVPNYASTEGWSRHLRKRLAKFLDLGKKELNFEDLPAYIISVYRQNFNDVVDADPDYPTLEAKKFFRKSLLIKELLKIPKYKESLRRYDGFEEEHLLIAQLARAYQSQKQVMTISVQRPKKKNRFQ